MNKLLRRAFVLWLPFVVALTGIFGFAYTATQQNYRQSMNDPQIQMAEDAALTLSNGGMLDAIVSKDTVPFDMRTSIAPWIAIYDRDGTPWASTAALDGAPPHMPDGLLDSSTWTALKTWQAPSGVETRVSWQPRPDVREAVVLVHFDSTRGGGWVAVGRSMRLVEERISNLTGLAAMAWSSTVLATFVAIFILLALGWL